MSTPAFVPAAQYLRMSTEHQQYSLENQAAAILQYAQSQGFAIVQTYTDAGRTGLVLKLRSGLRTLLQHVVSGAPKYRAILVYDVSRWGRFQDADEAAHYEFLCKQAGIPIHYCAEQFTNDGTIPSMILKALKRTMAGEYSRELSVKVYDGKRRLAELGFRQGGCPGFGLRRVLISQAGKRKQTLRRGEYKSLSTDRVILVPGLKSEVEIVREMYRMALRGKRPMWIVRELNRRGVPSSTGRPWDVYGVFRVLTNLKYTGCNTWGITSQKLRSRAMRVPAERWAVKPNAFVPIIDEQTFRRAQAALRDKTLYQSNDRILKRLKRFLAKKGRLTQELIDHARHLPGMSTIRSRFGSLRHVYEALGYQGSRRFYLRCERGRVTRRVRDDLVLEIQRLFPDHVTVVRPATHRRPIVYLDGKVPLSIKICQSRKTPTGARIWRLYPVLPAELGNMTLVCLLSARNDGVERYYVFPCMTRVGPLKFGERHRWLGDGKRLGSLAELYEAARNVAAQSVQAAAA